MFSPTEILTMVVYIIGLPLVRLALRPGVMPGRRLFIAAYCTAMGASICTVVEGVVLESLFNVLEHCMATIASLLFCLAIGKFLSDPGREEPTGRGRA